MFGHFDFSYVGLIYLLMLFIPNLIWPKNQPKDYQILFENTVLLVFERVGQVSVTCVVLVFQDFNINTISSWSVWLLVSFIFMLLYEIAWVRYFTEEHTEKNFIATYLAFLYL